MTLARTHSTHVHLFHLTNNNNVLTTLNTNPYLDCIIFSLDQGDLCRVLRRTMEVLRSLCLSSSLSSGLRDKARKAMDSLDRAPVTDDSYLTLQQSATVTDAASEEASEEEVPGDDGDEEEEEEECEEEGP